MYRVVKFPSLQVYRPKMLSSQFSSKVCSFCGNNNILVFPNLKKVMNKKGTLMFHKRHQGTNTSVRFINELLKRKRFKRDKRYFTELLEVFSNADALDTKAYVQNLKPIDISRIASNPKFDLAHLHSIKKTPTLHKVELNDKVNTKEPMVTSVFGMTDNSITNIDDSAFSATTSKVLASDEKVLFNDLDLKIGSVSTSAIIEATNGEIAISSKDGVEDHPEEFNEPQRNLDYHIEPDVLSIASVHPNFQEAFPEECESQHDEELENDLASHNALPTHPAKNHIHEKKRKVVWQRKKKDIVNKEKVSELERLYKEKNFNVTLYTYLRLCVSCNFLQRGLATLHYYMYRSKMSQKHSKITEVGIFEVLMQGFAAKGNYNKVNEVLALLATTSIKPSLDVFTSRLESVARSNKHKNKIPGIIKELNDMGYQLNDIFVKSTFLGDQREIILNAIQETKPDFHPKVPPPSICYSCSLLQEINDNQGKNLELRSPAKGLIDKAQLQKLTEEQLDNEFLYHMKVKSIEKRIEPQGVLEANRQKLNLMRGSWREDLKQGFQRDVTLLEMLKKPSAISLLPHLKVLDTEDYVDIMMKEIQRLAEGSETFSPHTFQLYRYVGDQIRNRYLVKFKKAHGILDKTKMLYNEYCDWYLDPTSNGIRSSNGRQEWQQLLHQHQKGPSITGEEEYWPSPVLLGLGKFLYNVIIGDVKVDVKIFNKTTKQHMLPAFYRVYRQQGVKVVEEIKPHPVISKLFRAAGEEDIMFDVTLVPMVSPPLPWTSYQSGGYLMSKTDLIRLPDQALQQRLRLKEAPPEQLYPSLDSLNQLGSIPWRVNQPVLDTVIEVFNNGGCGKLEIPEPPYLSPTAEPVNPSMTNKERYQAYRQRMVLRRHKAEMYSLWCDALYKLSLANHFRDRIFWLPHNMDFRGRVYPCPPHLNHLGADMPRSLLCFAQGQPLGPSGLDWLKIHIVNLLGTKKRESVQDRLDYANVILEDILDSAEKPLTGRKWWMESETPWQTLASCMEIRAALEHPEGPEHFISHFPIHQDGSCNGLQHYAALGRDNAGACSVNLMPQDLPQDVYSCVAALVERERAKDSANGVKLAQELDGFVRRKVIKQTVMTTVYGVTRFGARLQIAKQLKDIDSFPKEYVWPASTYLVTKTFESLREMFNSTKEIQDWFTECARLVSQTCGQNMEYVTPLGLPVVQHYCRPSKKLDANANKFGCLNEFFPIDMFERPNVMKQKNAFPPNFIHSLDSSHMMLTSIFSEQKGITFVSVHDCYWTHASTVHIMNQICREQFVELHSQPILEDLSQFMLQKYGFDKSELVDQENNLTQHKQKLQTILAQVPTKGTFILEHVLDSIYFFS